MGLFETNPVGFLFRLLHIPHHVFIVPPRVMPFSVLALMVGKALPLRHRPWLHL
jgi:hypothetical protein